MGGHRTDTGDKVSVSRTEPTDEALMVRFRSGERTALARLLQRHQTPLYNFVLRQLRNRPQAEEVVLETFARVVQNAADFKETARFAAWLYTIARNLCVDSLRKGSLRRHTSLDEPSGFGPGEGTTLGERTTDAGAHVEPAGFSREIRERVLSAIESLPEDQREVFLLREVSNLAFKDIAEVVGAPENTVKSRMRYALERLQAALREFEEYAHALR
ncbi:MAG: RNA polymerase sigma factor [Polyangiaceae bacterium]|jgi:RNA polymerase sigma-70 factor (ECF subfamily)